MKRIREDEFRIFDPSKEFQRSGIRNIPIRISQWCEVVQRIYPDAESSGCLLCMFSDGRVVCEIVYENVFFLRRYAGRKFFPALPVQQKDRVFHLFRFFTGGKMRDYFYAGPFPHRYCIETPEVFRDKIPVCRIYFRYCETCRIGDAACIFISKIEIESGIFSVFARRVPNLIASGNI